MAVSLARLPRFLVLEPVSTVRLEMELESPSCEIDVELQNPEPGRSFVLLIGKQGGPHLQRMRLSGRARILFEPKLPGVYVLMLANPQKEPLVLRLRARNIHRTAANDTSRRSRAHRRGKQDRRRHRAARTSRDAGVATVHGGRSGRPRSSGAESVRPGAPQKA